MRTFLLSIFWVSNVGNFVQLLIMVSASWILYSGAYSFSELSVSVFITQYVPWLLWLKTFIISLLGEFGRWLLEIPILVIAPLKFIAGTVIGLWAYTVAKKCLLSQFLHSTILAIVVALSLRENRHFSILSECLLLALRSVGSLVVM